MPLLHKSVRCLPSGDRDNHEYKREMDHLACVPYRRTYPPGERCSMKRKYAIWLVITYYSRLGHDARVILALHRRQPQTLESLTNELKTDSKGLKNDILPYLTARKIVKELQKNDITLYALADYDEAESKVQSAIKDFMLLYHRRPTVEEIGAKTGLASEEVTKLVYKLAPKLKWGTPTEEEQKTSMLKATRCLELAAWINQGCETLNFIMKSWTRNEYVQAKKILEKFPDYVPEITVSKVEKHIPGQVPLDYEGYAYTITWPEHRIFQNFTLPDIPAVNLDRYDFTKFDLIAFLEQQKMRKQANEGR